MKPSHGCSVSVTDSAGCDDVCDVLMCKQPVLIGDTYANECKCINMRMLVSHHDAAYQMKTSLFVWGSVITYHYDDDPHHHHHHHHDDDHDHDHDGVDPSSSFFHSSLCCFAACYVALGTWCGSCFTHYSCFPHMIGRSFGGVLVFPA